MDKHLKKSLFQVPSPRINTAQHDVKGQQLHWLHVRKKDMEILNLKEISNNISFL